MQNGFGNFIMSHSEEETNNEERPFSESDVDFYRSQFWKKLQNSRGSYVPTHIKNILKFYCSGTPGTFVCINDEILDELEKFARNAMKDFMEEERPIMKNYCGYYHQNPEKFKFIAGERTLIRYLVEYVL